MNSVVYKSVLRSVDWMRAVDYFVSFRIFMHQEGEFGSILKQKNCLKNHPKPRPAIDFDQNRKPNTKPSNVFKNIIDLKCWRCVEHVEYNITSVFPYRIRHYVESMQKLCHKAT